jgi:hypothetical protein
LLALVMVFVSTKGIDVPEPVSILMQDQTTVLSQVRETMDDATRQKLASSAGSLVVCSSKHVISHNLVRL